MTGLELLEIVKNDYPHIHVSMISAYGDEANYQKAIQSGAEGFFTKPIDFKALKEAIRQLLDEQ